MDPLEQTKSIVFISRKQLATRWSCSIETIKRKEKQGLIVPLRLGKRMLRYRLDDIQKLEDAGIEESTTLVGS